MRRMGLDDWNRRSLGQSVLLLNPVLKSRLWDAQTLVSELQYGNEPA